MGSFILLSIAHLAIFFRYSCLTRDVSLSACTAAAGAVVGIKEGKGSKIIGLGSLQERESEFSPT